MRIIRFINAARILVFFVSTGALGCHIVQCALLRVYQDQAHIPSWVEAGHWQYLSWYIALGLSTVSGAAVCMHAFCCKRTHVVRGDRFLGILSMLPLAVSLLTALFVDTAPEPWTAGTVHFSRPLAGFFGSCSVFDSQQQPLLYQRCMLVDGTWVGAAMACLLWTMLVCMSVFARSASSGMVAAETAKEPKWGRYIPERPASLQSVSVQIVPPPPPHHLRHSVVCNTYVPRSDASFDSRASTATYDRRGSWYYSDQDYCYSPPPFSNSFDHRYPTTPVTPTYQQPPLVPMLPMVPQMDSIELFGGAPHPQAAAYVCEKEQHQYFGSMPPPLPPPIEREQLFATSPPYNSQASFDPFSPAPPHPGQSAVHDDDDTYTSSKVELLEEPVPPAPAPPSDHDQPHPTPSDPPLFVESTLPQKPHQQY